jgi:hypothetical protein
MKTFHLENLPLDPPIEAGEDAMRKVEKSSPFERTYDLAQYVESFSKRCLLLGPLVSR